MVDTHDETGIRKPTVGGWEKVAKNTERLKVPGGWLYQVGSTGVSVRLCFVPDPLQDGPRRLASKS